MLNGKAKQPMRKRTANGASKKRVLHVRLRCGWLSITTPVSLLANDFDVRSVLQRQQSLSAVNQIYVIHEAMNGCKKSKHSLKACFENINIFSMTFVMNVYSNVLCFYIVDHRMPKHIVCLVWRNIEHCSKCCKRIRFLINQILILGMLQ